LFQTFARYLLWLGISTELEKDEPLLRPDQLCSDKKIMTEARAKNQDFNTLKKNCEAMRIDTATSVNVKVSGSLGGLSGQGNAGVPGSGSAGGGSSGGEGSPRKYSLCFAPRSDAAEKMTLAPSRCGQSPRPYYALAAEAAGKTLDYNDDEWEYDTSRDLGKMAFHIYLNELVIDEMRRIVPLRIFNELLSEAKKDKDKKAKVSVEVDLRSTEGIIYYLGEIARRQLDPKYSNNPRVFFTNRHHYMAYKDPDWSCILSKNDEPLPEYCFPIFEPNVGLQPNAFLSTLYDGVLYSVPSGGRSGQVLEIDSPSTSLRAPRYSSL
jgi:hypothetical protein